MKYLCTSNHGNMFVHELVDAAAFAAGALGLGPDDVASIAAAIQRKTERGGTYRRARGFFPRRRVEIRRVPA